MAKKIIFYSFPNFAYGGGFEKYIIDLANLLSKDGYSVKIITISRLLQKYLEYFLQILYLKFDFNIKNKFRLTRAEILSRLNNSVKLIEVNKLKDFKSHIRNSDYLYCKNEILDLFFLKFFIRPKNINLLIGMHTAIYYPNATDLYSKIHNLLYGSKFYYSLIKNAKKIHVINSFDKKLLEQRFNLNNVYMISYFFKPIRVKANPVNSSIFSLGFIGRLNRQKGIPLLCDIIHKLNKSKLHNKLFFNIAGSGSQKDLIIDLTKRYSNVKYFGFITPGKVNKFYLLNDVILVTSLWESFGQIILEANRLGIPVIATNIPGPKDIIINGKNGFLVNNVHGFYQKIDYYYKMKIDNKFNKIRPVCLNSIRRFDEKKIINEIEKNFFK